LASLSGGAASAASTATSSDGITWTTAALAFETAAVTTGSAWNGTQFMVVGASATDTIMTSATGLTFSGLGKTVFTTSGFGACYGASYSRWVLTGSGTAGQVYSLSAADGSTTFNFAFSTQGNRCFAKF
jgi:hypothetical protein